MQYKQTRLPLLDIHNYRSMKKVSFSLSLIAWRYEIEHWPKKERKKFKIWTKSDFSFFLLLLLPLSFALYARMYNMPKNSFQRVIFRVCHCQSLSIDMVTNLNEQYHQFRHPLLHDNNPLHLFSFDRNQFFPTISLLFVMWDE